MAASPDEWKLDPDMPRLFLYVMDDGGQEVKWGSQYRSSFDLTKHVDSKMEEARLRGLVLTVTLRLADPEEVYGKPEPEATLRQAEDELPDAS